MAEEGEETPQLNWTGAFDDEGKPHGQGLLTYPAPAKKEEDEEEKPGDKFEGTLSHGQRDGKGNYVWSNGCYYDGQYKDHMRHGHGTLTFPDKSRYEGDWSENKMHGQGLYTYANGDMYTGAFEHGVKHGQGSYYFKATECQFIGEWVDGVFMSGTWALQDGSLYKGQFGNKVDALATFTANCGLQQDFRNNAGHWTAVGRLEVSTS
ncbi:hypothetical protein WJX82_003420 [Trebouxia sp. C0006]